MDNTEDNSRYGYGSSNRQKIPFRGGSYSRPVATQYVDEDLEVDDDDEEEEDEELGEDENEEEEEDNNNNNGLSNGYPVVRKDSVDIDTDDDDDDDDEDDDDDDDDDDDHGDEKRKEFDGSDLERRRKKRKLKSLISSYEFAPRVPPAPAPGPGPAPSSGAGRSPLTDWTERETVALLDAWGDRFLRRGKKSLRSEEWREVAERVSEASEADRTDTQCRNRLDTLKKKYKKEKLAPSTKWVYFKKMDLLLSTSPSSNQQQQPSQQQHQQQQQLQQPGLSCGLDSGEYVFTNPRVYLSRANRLDEMRDSPGNSESDSDDDDGSDGLPPKKRKYGRDEDEGDDDRGGSSSSFRLIADSIKKFSDVYEKIEASKRQQMMEIEKMRMDFQRDLEMQKRQIMERAHAEIARIRRGIDEDIDGSAENGSG